MDNSKTNSLSISSITYNLLRTSAVGISFTNILYHAEQNSYISVIIGFILGLIPMFIYFKLIDKYQNLNIIQINELLFGKILGKIINITISIFIAVFITINMRNLSDFIYSQFLNSTPTYIISGVFLIPIIYILTKGINVIGKTGLILFYINIFIAIIILVSLIYQVKIDNFLPILNKGMIPVLKGSYNFIAYNLLPMFLITIIPKNKIIEKEKYFKHQFVMYALSSVKILIDLILIIGIFGINLSRIFAYPEYHVLKRISLFNMLERAETMLSLNWILGFFITIVIGLYFITECINITFDIRQKKPKTIIIFLASILVIIGSEYIFKNHTQSSMFLLNIFPHLLYIFFLGIPTIILIISSFKNNKNIQT